MHLAGLAPNLSDVTRVRLSLLTLVPLLIGCTSARARADEADRIAAVLQLRVGSIVADVGAGEGEWSEILARSVGPTGHVYATEVKSHLVEEIGERLRDASLTNFTTVEGDQERTGLPAECCDAILLRMVYHHFERPELMRADLWRALRPGGLIAMVDIVPQKNWRQLDNVPDRGGHGIPVDDLITELTASGLQLVEHLEDWNGEEDRYCLVFRKPST